MNKVLGLALLGVGGYVLYEMFFAQSAPVGTTATPGTSLTPAATASAPTAAMTALANSLNAAMPQWWNPQPGQPATFNGLATVDQWNWVMTNKTNPGSQSASLSLPGNITALAYVQARAAVGLGLSGYRPLMTMAHRRNYVRRLA